eukprot:TRINITY_DN90343_c0_g1_i1.p1 TRINITY_DN90343_c0_g1~~TRINITY_DN90343_c0_g1_i1.p1  ORF type:complete len:166 (+),score=33.53 TRINITY_DN90343_c0_g1_i1:113-610(+)
MNANPNVANDPGWDVKRTEQAYKDFCKRHGARNECILLKQLADCLRHCGADPVDEVELARNHIRSKNVAKDTIDFQQFIRIMNEFPTPSRKVFNMFDRDGNGTISKDELKAILMDLDPSLTEEEILDLFEETDEDHNGDIDYLEFDSVFGQDPNMLLGAANSSAS